MKSSRNISGGSTGWMLVLMTGIAAGLTTQSGSAWAQERRPLPPPPPSATDGFDRIENLGKFVEAYQRSGSPRMLICADLFSRTGELLNDKGSITALGSRLEEYFRHPEITLVNADAARNLARNQAEALSRNDEFSAARMLGQQSKADLVLYVRLLEQSGRRDGVSYAASYVLADLARGTTLARHSWDMFPDAESGEFDARWMGEYARSIARRVAAQYIEHYPHGGGLAGMRKFTVRLVGDHLDEDIAGFRDALKSIPGVNHGSVQSRGKDKSAATSMHTFDLSFAGDIIDLQLAARRAAVDNMAMQADIIDAREGSITVRLNPLEMTERQRMLTGGPQTPRNKAEREKLAAAYAKVGSPTMAMMVNKAAVEKEESLVDDSKQPAGGSIQSGDGVNIIIAERVGVDNLGGTSRFLERVVDRELRDRREERKEDAIIDTRVFEDKVLGRLLSLGLRPRDLSAAQAELGSTQEFQTRKWNDRDLAFALGKAAKADIVISGIGKLVRSRAGAAPLRVVYTMRAYNIADGNMIAAATVQRDIAGSDETLNRVEEELAAEATGTLVAGMLDAWERAK